MSDVTRTSRVRTSAQPPLETHAPSLHAPPAGAGGTGAIVNTMRHAVKHMGVRRSLTLLGTNQMQGFDCPGCAWPEPDHDRSSFEFCENGAKAVASEATLARIDRDFFRRYSVAELGEKSDYWLNEQGRLTEPMVLRKGATHYTPLSWDEAFELVASHLRRLESPHRAAFYTSGRTSNEAAFLYQAFVRMLGTNNLPDCSNMCHESSGHAMAESLGVGKGTVTLDDFAQADAIFVVGQNPGTNHPRMLSTLKEAKLRGATIVSVNPMDEAGTRKFAHPQDPVDVIGGGVDLQSLFVQVRVNGDVALFQGIAKALLEAEDEAPGSVLDHAFLAEHTSDFEPYAAHVRSVSWEALEVGSGVPKETILRAAAVMRESKATIICWAMGVTQHKNGVDNVREIVNVLLLRGNVGRPGAGACPVRGHSNVQGDRTMGIWEKMPESFLSALGRELGFSPPREEGYDTVATIEAMLDGKLDVFFGMGGNFLSATPDTERVASGMRACKLTAHVATKLNRGHLVTGEEALLLPCLGRTETDLQASGPQFVTVENSMSVVSMSKGTLPPASPTLKSEVAIVAGIAEKTLAPRATLDWSALVADYDRIRELIARVVPGFSDFAARVREPGGFYLGNAARDRVFRTHTEKARFSVHPIAHHDLSGGRLLMMTLRSHDQYNTTVYGLDDRYRGIENGRRLIMMNADDIAARGLSQGDYVDLVGHAEDGSTRVAEHFLVVPYGLPRSCCATYFPETNVLVPLESYAEGSRTPASKSVVITVHRSAS